VVIRWREQVLSDVLHATKLLHQAEEVEAFTGRRDYLEQMATLRIVNALVRCLPKDHDMAEDLQRLARQLVDG